MSNTQQNNLSSKNTIGVLLVDDSAVIRGALSKILDTDPSISIVSSVSNGEMGIQSAKRYKPDIVILDIEMPVMDGLTALPEIMKASPNSKVIMFSSLTESGASFTLKALAAGAVECIVKPSSAQGVGEGSEFHRNMLNIIRNLCPDKATGGVSLKQPAATTASQPASVLSPDKPISLRQGLEVFRGKPSILAIGSSTGGPNALFEVIKSLKEIDIPVVLTQHMPATFTKILAEHITQQTGVEAFEASDGMRIENGKIYVAPGGLHMKIEKDAQGLFAQLDDGPAENFCKPSVEPMLRSVLNIFGNKTLGLILTGMGNDGIKGGKLLSECGGRLIAQDEATSVVWGMPGAVAKAGFCTDILPLNDIGPQVRKTILG